MAADAQPPAGSTSGEQDLALSPRHGGTEIYLIRHGDALPDATEVVLDAHYDSQPLSALGRRQAEALAAVLRDARLSAIVSSPIPRARQTAEPLARASGLEVQIDDDLREAEVGTVGPDLPPDATAEQASRIVRERLHRIAAIVLTTGSVSGIPGSEPSATLRARARATIARIAARYPGARVAAVSHGALINAVFASVLDIERDYFFPCANTSISILRVKGERSLLLALNDVGHLRQAGLLS
jgi:broad specificity phosphatase PhoE